MIAIHVAATATKARTKVIDACRLKGATAPERAQSLPALGLEPGDRYLAELVDQGVIRGVDRRGRAVVIGDEHNPSESYWLDEAAVIANRNGRESKSAKQAVFVVLAILLLFAGFALVLRAVRG